MKQILLLLITLMFTFSAEAQVTENNQAYNDMENNPIMKTLRGSLKNSGDQKTARNLLIVKKVADYKFGDERLEKEFERVENNKEYHRKIEQIMSNLSNNRMRNSKNKEVIRILDDAGDKLYKLLAN